MCHVDSLSPGGSDCNLKFVIFKLISRGGYLEHFFLNFPQVNATKPHRWLVNIDSGKGLVPSGTKPLPELMFTQIYAAMSLGHNDFSNNL